MGFLIVLAERVQEDVHHSELWFVHFIHHCRLHRVRLPLCIMPLCSSYLNVPYVGLWVCFDPDHLES